MRLVFLYGEGLAETNQCGQHDALPQYQSKALLPVLASSPPAGYIQLTEEKLKGTGFEAGDPITIEVRRGLILIYRGEEYGRAALRWRPWWRSFLEELTFRHGLD